MLVAMNKEQEKKQWDICVWCGETKSLDINDPEVKGIEEYARQHPWAYTRCPRRCQSKPVLPQEQLEHGAYYHGKCRNAVIARWNSETQKFVYMREKFGYVYPEAIGYWVEGHVFDEFRPYGKMENPPFEIPLVCSLFD